MRRRSRIAAYGSAVALIVIGVVCAVVISAGAGQIAAFVLIGLGLMAITALAFLEVGFSEDRERERERAAKADAVRSSADGERRRLKRPRLDRARDHRRRLR